MKFIITLIMLAFPLFGLAAELPSWVNRALAEVENLEPPENVFNWTVLDETHIKLQPDGKWYKSRRVVHKVLSSRYADSLYYTIDGNEEATKILKLRGWHSRGGRTVTLDRDNVSTLGMSNTSLITQDTSTFAYFERVSEGSVVAFESEELLQSYFTQQNVFLLGKAPIARRVIELAGFSDGVVLEPLAMEDWGLTYKKNGTRLELTQLPALQSERLTPEDPTVYPRVVVGFRGDPGTDPTTSWENMARWYFATFYTAAMGQVPGEINAASDLADLNTAAAMFSDKMAYRQKYLDPSRNWEPLNGHKIAAQRYGDCKDMVACLTAILENKVTPLPALANIGEGYTTTASSYPGPYFNHLIAAIPLSASLGLAAEVELDGQRYLIYDPTNNVTALGYLSSDYRGRSILICHPEGARWLQIPDTALEPASLEAELTGLVDDNYGLEGTLTLVEKGNAFRLRSASKGGTPRDLNWAARKALDVPAAAELFITTSKLDDEGALILSFHVFWPSFLFRDAGGFRLPTGITGGNKISLRNGGRIRQQPIQLSESLPVTWDIKLSCPIPLQARKATWQWPDDPYTNLSWEVKSGTVLKIKFNRSRSQINFPMDQKEQGLAYWSNYRKTYGSFLMEAALFHPQ